MFREYNTGLKNRTVKVGPLLDKILAGFGLAHNLGGWRIVNRWPEIVGDKIAEVSKAIRFSDDTLMVSRQGCRLAAAIVHGSGPDPEGNTCRPRWKSG